MALYPYPADFPSAEVLKLVADAIRNKTLDVKESVHACWQVAGYGLSQWDPHKVGMPAIGDLDAADMLDGLAEGKELVLPWVILVPIIIKVIEKLLPLIVK